MKIKEFQSIINKFLNHKRYKINYTSLNVWMPTQNLYKIKDSEYKIINGQKCKIINIRDTSGRSFIEIKNYNFGL